jgi:MazG family protein
MDNSLLEFKKTVKNLRKKCPWDKKQNHSSLTKYLVEETYEAIEAIENKNPKKIEEELGDVLLQVFLHAEIASEKKHFDIFSIAKKIDQKMKVRHPHIYGDLKYKDYKTHIKNWNNSKTKENPKKSLLEGTPKSMPALLLAQRYGEVAAGVGFDWPNIQGVIDKVTEECLELKKEIKNKNKKKMEMEFGDLLFTLTRLASYLKVDAEKALKISSDKFYKRFSALELEFSKKGKKLSDSTIAEMEKVWQQVKKQDIKR